MFSLIKIWINLNLILNRENKLKVLIKPLVNKPKGVSLKVGKYINILILILPFWVY